MSGHLYFSAHSVHVLDPPPDEARADDGCYTVGEWLDYGRPFILDDATSEDYTLEIFWRGEKGPHWSLFCRGELVASGTYERR